MSRKALAPLLIGVAAASFGLAATAGSAQAAACSPSVSVSPNPVPYTGATVTITGHNFACTTTAKVVHVDARDFTKSQTGNGPTVTLDSSGGFTDKELIKGDPGATITIKVDGKTYGSFLLTPIDPTVQTTAPTAVPAVPTAVPAGHVAVTKAGSDDTTEIGLVAAAGLVLVAGGVTVGMRGRGSRASV